MNSHDLIDLGKIASAHGLCGEVNYIPFNAASNLPLPDMTVSIRFPDGKAGSLKVVSVRDKGKFRLLTFEGITDRTDAEKLTGSIVTCPRADLPDLESSEFYYSDILGLPVRFPDGREVGTVTQVLSLATDVIEIRSESGVEWMIPVVDGFVRSVSRTEVVIEPEALEME